jgi:glycosyltransferase involved in cell wall biosynthesis
MKIATMVRGSLIVPPPPDMLYPPMSVARAVSEGLVARGHDVTFFGPVGTEMPMTLETLNMRPLAHRLGEFESLLKASGQTHNQVALWDQYMAREMFERAREGEFDLLHLHHPEASLPIARLYPDVPVVYTLHDELTPGWRELLEMYLSPNQRFISISDNQRQPAPDLPYLATIYNGIDTNFFTPGDENERDDFLLFVGRMVPDKGVREAIKVAKQTGHRLFMVGPTYPTSQGYFDQYVRPELDEKILYLGLMEREQLLKYYQKAKALLFPVQWEEPFGMSMVEAMSCGTPVIALRRGSIPEVVAHGSSGFIANSVSEMVKAVDRLPHIDPRECRAHAERNFSHGRMVNHYISAFREALKLAQVDNGSAIV